LAPRCIKTPLPTTLSWSENTGKGFAAGFAVDNGITDYRMLHKLLYRSFRERFKLPSAYLQL
jgi:hypothetical protein